MKTKPNLPQVNDSNFLRNVKECLETIMGRRTDKIKPLEANASLGDVILKINEVIDRLQ